MINIDNSNLLGYNKNLDYTAFGPALNYTYNAATGAIVVTDASVIPAGDTFKHINVIVHDGFGGSVKGEITAAAGAVNLSAATLDVSNGLNITATVVTDKGLHGDGAIFNIVAAGKVKNWQKGESAAEAEA